MRARYISALSAALALGTLSHQVSAQNAVNRDVNQISGTIVFANPSKLEPIVGSEVTAYSVSPSGLRASTGPTITSPGNLEYLLSVQAGIDHTVYPYINLDGGRDRYEFTRQTSGTIPPQPAAGPTINFNECAGFVHVRWLSAGSLVPLRAVAIDANREQTPGLQDFSRQAYTRVNNSTGEETFAVRGDNSLYRIDINYQTGTDPYLDTINEVYSQDVTVACDQTVTIDITVPDNGGNGTGGPGSDLGRIIGNINLDFESEDPTTSIQAWGPLGNSRWAQINTTPASGAFTLPNLVPSSRTSPSTLWWMQGYMRFKGILGIVQDFNTPYFSTTVGAGQTVDIGSTYNMTEGFMLGDVLIEGTHACSHQFSIPDARFLAYGADSVSSGGYATSGIQAQFVNSTKFAGKQAIVGKQALAVGTPNNVPAAWNPYLTAIFRDPNGTNSRTNVSIKDNLVGYPTVSTANTQVNAVNVPVRMCFGQYNVPFTVNSGVPAGTKFRSPVAYVSGAFKGQDFAKLPADYSAGATVYGLPETGSVSATNIPLCVPEGKYDVTPAITAVGATADSYTELLKTAVEVPCGGIVNPFQVTFERTSCAATAGELSFSMKAKGALTPTAASQIYFKLFPNTPQQKLYWICGGGSAPSCAPGGLDPSFPFKVNLADLGITNQCAQYSVVVEAVDVDGNISQSATRSFAYEAAPPPPNPCLDANVKINVPADLASSIAPLNKCGYDPKSVKCRDYGLPGAPAIPLTGNAFTKTTTVQCQMATECFANRSCTFKVNATN